MSDSTSAAPSSAPATADAAAAPASTSAAPAAKAQPKASAKPKAKADRKTRADAKNGGSKPAPARAATAAKKKAAATPAAPAERDAKARKPKLVRDSFTMPKDEYAAIESLKQRLALQGTPAKKSELLRAGLVLLSGLQDAALAKAMQAVPSLKTGRPRAEPADSAQKQPTAAKTTKPRAGKKA